MAYFLRIACAELGDKILQKLELHNFLDDLEFEELGKVEVNGRFRDPLEYGETTHLRLIATILNMRIMVFTSERMPLVPVLPFSLNEEPPPDCYIYLFLHGEMRDGHIEFGHFNLVTNIILKRVRN